jgi:hypothetical protein
MPSPPELTDITLKIWQMEILHQTDAKQFRRTNGDIRIAREITIYLECKQNHPYKECQSIGIKIAIPNLINGKRAVVGYY